MSGLPSHLKFVVLAVASFSFSFFFFFDHVGYIELQDKRGVLKQWKWFICALAIWAGFCQSNMSVSLSPGISGLFLLPTCFLFSSFQDFIQTITWADFL